MGLKFEKIRKSRHFSITNMARTLEVNRVTYVNNENGRTIPNFFTLYNLGYQFDVSLDWFVFNEEPVYRTEKTGEKKVQEVSPLSQLQPLLPDIKELLDHMDKIPLLRYEILVQFFKFKEEHQAMVEKAMKTNPVA
jgi:transcriptional regulator with XRE-family HTH domain